MRKRLITPTPETIRSRGEGWLDVERAAVVEITSEEKDYPVESVFVSGETRGWRAAAPGPQTIRLVFDQPQTLNRYRLCLRSVNGRLYALNSSFLFDYVSNRWWQFKSIRSS